MKDEIKRRGADLKKMDGYDDEDIAEINRHKKLERLNRNGSRLIRYSALMLLFFAVFFVSFDFSYKYALKTEENLDVLRQTGDMEVINGVEIEIPYDSGTEDIAGILKDGGFIDNTFVFRLLSKINGYDDKYQAGMHIISDNMNLNELMFVLSGSPEIVRVMIPEGYTIDQIAEKLSLNNVIDKETFYKALDEETFSYEFLQNITVNQYQNHALEGFMFPDTYDFNVYSRPRDVLLKFFSNFDVKFKASYYTKMKQLELSMHDLLTLASIVERESYDTHDRRIIAAILYKRWHSQEASMQYLQSCATLQYIFLRDTGSVKEKIYYTDTEIDDKYNTYKYRGLPPGPICNPSKDAILAVLNMTKDTEYWYFCAKGDGTTYFSKTYSEHEEAVRKYQYITEGD